MVVIRGAGHEFIPLGFRVSLLWATSHVGITIDKGDRPANVAQQ